MNAISPYREKIKKKTSKTFIQFLKKGLVGIDSASNREDSGNKSLVI